MSQPFDVVLRFLERQAMRPPLENLVFDTELINRSPEPTWFIFPITLGPNDEPTAEGGVNGLEVFRIAGHGQLILARFLGMNGFQALRLPAGGEVRLERLKIGLWSEERVDAVSIEVAFARNIMIDSQTADTWMGLEASCSLRAEVNSEDALSLSVKQTPGLECLPVSLLDEQRRRIAVDLR
jgi:hypothetical protein